jgi:hypothetical protein
MIRLADEKGTFMITRIEVQFSHYGKSLVSRHAY